MKEYEGGVVGLQETNLTIGEGVFALLGPNGAGKSTLMSILATLLEPTSGTATVGGCDVRKDKNGVRHQLGYLPQAFGLYPALTVRETLDYVGMLYDLRDRADRARRIEDVIARVNLGAVADRQIAHLSGGMRQRVGLAQALLNEPKLLIVDEPTAGLDPEERIRVRSLLAELGSGRVVLLSTHLIEDVHAIADNIAVLHLGRMRFSGTAAEMRGRVSGRVWEISAQMDQLSSIRGKYVETALQRDGNRILIRVVAESVDIPNAVAVEPTLEDAYIWLMREEANVPVA